MTAPELHDMAAVVDELRQTVAALNNYIAERATNLAAPRIARAKQAAADRIAEIDQSAELSERRWRDMETELRRQIAARDRQIDRLRAENDRLLAEQRAQV